jgi:hypothetical protein
MMTLAGGDTQLSTLFRCWQLRQTLSMCDRREGPTLRLSLAGRQH